MRYKKITMTPNDFIELFSNLDAVSQWLETTPGEQKMELIKQFTFEDFIALAQSFENQTFFKNSIILSQLSRSNPTSSFKLSPHETQLQNTFAALFSIASDTFSDLIKTPEQLETFSNTSFSLYLALFDVNKNKFTSLFTTVEQVINMKLILLSFVLVPPHTIMKFITHSHQLETLPEETVEILFNLNVDEVVTRFRTPEDLLSFKYQKQIQNLAVMNSALIIDLFTSPQQFITPLCLNPTNPFLIFLSGKQPQKIAAMLKSSDELIALHKASGLFTQNLTYYCSDILIALFPDSNEVIKTAQEDPGLLYFLLIRKQKELAGLFQTAADFLALIKADKETARWFLRDPEEKIRIAALLKNDSILRELEDPIIAMEQTLQEVSRLQSTTYEYKSKYDSSFFSSRTAEIPSQSNSTSNYIKGGMALAGGVLFIAGLVSGLSALLIIGVCLAVLAAVAYCGSCNMAPSTIANSC